MEDKNAFFSDPYYLDIVAPNEHVFADMAQTRFLVYREDCPGVQPLLCWPQAIDTELPE